MVAAQIQQVLTVRMAAWMVQLDELLGNRPVYKTRCPTDKGHEVRVGYCISRVPLGQERELFLQPVVALHNSAVVFLRVYAADRLFRDSASTCFVSRRFLSHVVNCLGPIVGLSHTYPKRCERKPKCGQQQTGRFNASTRSRQSLRFIR